MRAVAICDAYSTGAKLAPLFREQGFKTIHLRSSDDPPADFLATYVPADFDIELGYGGNKVQSIAARLSEHSPEFVIAGTESGVELAESLSHQLSTPSNTAGGSKARRDKYEMLEAVKSAGLRTSRQVRISNEAGLRGFDADGFEMPVVVKPVNSAGGDGFRLCQSVEEASEHVSWLLGRRNAVGEVNANVIVQEYLSGQQYFVNCTSIGGKHFVSEIWRDERRPGHNGTIVCWKEELLDLKGSLQKELVQYTCAVLDALGVREGASHTELMLTCNGPVLIESAARMQGTIDETAVRRATGVDVVSLSVLRYAHPSDFITRMRAPIERRTCLWCISLVSYQKGRITDARGLQLIRSLRSFHSAIHLPRLGSSVTWTNDLFSSPGIIYLVGSHEAVSEDHETIRQMEKGGEIFNVV